MTRSTALLLGLSFVAMLYVSDRVIAGMVQCRAADVCPYAREFGGVR